MVLRSSGPFLSPGQSCLGQESTLVQQQQCGLKGFEDFLELLELDWFSA